MNKNDYIGFFNQNPPPKRVQSAVGHENAFLDSKALFQMERHTYYIWEARYNIL